MDKLKKKLHPVLKRIQNVVTNRNVAYAVLLLSVFWFFTTIDMPSAGMESFVLGCALMAAYLPQSRQMRNVLPAFVMCVVALALLVFSGRLGEIDFNAPVHHALKYVNIFFVQVLLILMFRQPKKHRRVVLLTAVALLVVGMIISIFCALFIDPYAIRYFADGGFTMVLDFNQMYAVPFLIAAVMCVFLSKVKSWNQVWVYLPWLLLAALCIYLSLYTIALLLTVLGCGLSFLFSQYYRSLKRFWIIIGVCAAVVILCFVFRQQVSNLVYAVTEGMNWLVKARIRSVVDMVLGTAGDNWYTPDTRMELAGYSLHTFMSHPVFGIGYSQYQYGVIGCHQEWFDMLGVFGVVGTVVFLVAMVGISVQTYRNARTPVDKGSFLICLTMFIVLGFLNPVLNMPVLLTVFVIAPNISLLPMPELAQVRDWAKNKVQWIKSKLEKKK